MCFQRVTHPLSWWPQVPNIYYWMWHHWRVWSGCCSWQLEQLCSPPSNCFSSSNAWQRQVSQALHVWQWETLKPQTNHRKNVISWRMDLSFSLAVHTDKISVPWHPRGELLWSPALSSKMLCTPFLLIISLIRACKMLWRMMPKCLRAPVHFRGSPLFLPYRHLCPSHLIDLGKWALSIWDQS